MKNDEPWIDKVEKWFKEGEDSANELLSLPWEIVIDDSEKGKVLVAKHPKVPFEINAVFGTEIIKLGIVTNLETDFLEPIERLKIYKLLLVMNQESSLIKIGLSGLESTIIVGSDLDTSSLGREEFNDALSAVVMGTYSVYKMMGKEDVLNQIAFQKVIELALSQLNTGEKPGEVVSYLSEKVGMDAQSAEQLVSSLVVARKDQKKESKEDLVYFG